MKGIQIAFVSMMFAVMIISAISLMGKIDVLTREQKKFEELKSRVIRTTQEAEENIVALSGEKTMEEREILPEFRELYEENKDFCGWITIEGTKIDYPVMQSLNDREFYLHRDFYGEDSYAGVPFIGNGDVRSANRDLFIYGHNMKNGTMFADMLNYRSKEYWEEHPVIKFDTLREHREYEIFTVFYATENDWLQESGIFYLEVQKAEIEKDKYLQDLKDRGIYGTGIIDDKNASLIFLVTCSYQETNGRFVVVGILNRNNDNKHTIAADAEEDVKPFNDVS